MSVFKKYIEPYNKELTDLLYSNIKPETKVYFFRAVMHNLSRTFNKALNLNSHIKDRCMIKTQRGFYTVTLTTHSNELTCRQFYEDLDGFYCYCIFTDKMYRVDNNIIEDSIKCGTGNETISARSVTVPSKDAIPLTLIEFEEEVYV